MPLSFLYFDLGNVLLTFDNDIAARQMADVSGVAVERIKAVVFDGLGPCYERGEVDTRQFYEIFCEQTGTRPDYEALKRASSDMFSLNARIVPLVAALQRAGYRLGILSNTNEMHWAHVSGGRYGIIPGLFERTALSFEVGALKPDRAIFTAAAEMAGVEPAEIFFVDDRPENVQGARAVGFDAVQYTTPPALAAELRKRGLKFNY